MWLSLALAVPARARDIARAASIPTVRPSTVRSPGFTRRVSAAIVMWAAGTPTRSEELGRAQPMSQQPEAFATSRKVQLPRPLLVIQATWPTRRTFRDRDLRAFHWCPELAALIAVEIWVMQEGDRQHPVLNLDWNGLVS